MIIPPQWNDGFTSICHTQNGPVRVRKILQRDLRLLAPYGAEKIYEEILKEPYYVGPDLKSLESVDRGLVVLYIMGSQNIENEMLKEIFDTAVMLHENHGITKLSCHDCRQFATDHKTGEILTTPDGRPKRRSPVLPVPCEIQSQGCPKGHWSKPKEPSSLGIAVWEHYWEMKAARLPALDGIMMRNWALIEWVTRYGRRPEFNPRVSRTVGRSTGDPVRSGGEGGRAPEPAGAGDVPVGDVRPTAGATSNADSEPSGTGDAAAADERFVYAGP